MIERPLDLVNDLKGKEISIELKDGKVITGFLMAWDQHINLVLDNAKTVSNGESKHVGLMFVKGNFILWMNPASGKKK